MADSKTTQLNQLAATPDVADQLMIVDVSDTSMAATGTNKRLAASYIARSDAGAKLITGNGRELTVPATGTAAVVASGTWTPVLLLGGTNVGMSYSNNSGHYELLGDYVWIMGIVALSAKGSSVGVASIAGLPYQVKSYSTALNLVCNDMALSIASTYGHARVLTAQYFDLMVIPAAGALSPSQLNHAWFNNTSTLWFSGFYKAV